jgi:hypothetical protein
MQQSQFWRRQASLGKRRQADASAGLCTARFHQPVICSITQRVVHCSTAACHVTRLNNKIMTCLVRCTLLNSRSVGLLFLPLLLLLLLLLLQVHADALSLLHV